jgi:hypothetical protein
LLLIGVGNDTHQIVSISSIISITKVLVYLEMCQFFIWVTIARNRIVTIVFVILLHNIVSGDLLDLFSLKKHVGICVTFEKKCYSMSTFTTFSTLNMDFIIPTLHMCPLPPRRMLALLTVAFVKCEMEHTCSTKRKFASPAEKTHCQRLSAMFVLCAFRANGITWYCSAMTSDDKRQNKRKQTSQKNKMAANFVLKKYTQNTPKKAFYFGFYCQFICKHHILDIVYQVSG